MNKVPLQAPWTSKEDFPGVLQWGASFGYIQLRVVYRYELWNFYVDVGPFTSHGTTAFTALEAAQRAAEISATAIVNDILERLVPDAVRAHAALSRREVNPMTSWEHIKNGAD